LAALLLGRFRYRPLRQIDHSPFQMLQTGLPNRRREHSDELIELAIAVCDHGFEGPVSEVAGSASVFGATSPMFLQSSRKTSISFPLLSSQRSKTDGATAINFQSRSKASSGSRASRHLDDGTAGSIEVIHQRSDALPIDKRPRPRNDREPFAYLLPEFTGAPSAGQLQLKPSLGSGIAAADLDQQLCQSLGAEGFEVRRVKSRFSRHPAFLAG
jgi:hypothetical protein